MPVVTVKSLDDLAVTEPSWTEMEYASGCPRGPVSPEGTVKVIVAAPVGSTGTGDVSRTVVGDPVCGVRVTWFTEEGEGKPARTPWPRYLPRRSQAWAHLVGRMWWSERTWCM